MKNSFLFHFMHNHHAMIRLPCYFLVGLVESFRLKDWFVPYSLVVFKITCILELQESCF
jgi:hypothetical protein